MRGAFLLLVLLAGCDRAAPPAANQAQPSAPTAAPAAQPRAAPLPASHPWSPTGYALTGTEPFWGGTVTGNSVRYMIPEDQFGKVVETRPDHTADRETYRGSLRGRPFVLTLTAGPCSDGMSDHTYAFTASLEVSGEARRGCADPADNAQGEH